jgi:hypothetical protein
MVFDMLVVVIIILILCIMCRKHNKHHAPCDTDEYLTFRSDIPKTTEITNLDRSDSTLNEAEQDTQTRGSVPPMNQPDHVANFWKSDQSQSSEFYQNNKQDMFDKYMGTKGSAAIMNPTQASNMHVTSRFATLRSQ